MFLGILENSFSKINTISVDEISSDTKSVLISSILLENKDVFGICKKYSQYDSEKVKLKQKPSMMTDNFLLLYTSTVNKREDRLKNQSIILKNNPDEILKNVVNYNIDTDEINLYNRLRHEDRYNRFASVFNYISETFSQMITGNTQVVAKFFVDIFFSYTRFNDFTVREKKSLVLLSDFNEKYPDYKENKRISKKIDKLKKDKENYLYKRYLSIGDMYVRSGNLEEAIIFYKEAEKIFPKDKDVKKRMLNAQKILSKDVRNSVKSLIVVDGEKNFSQKENEVYGNLLYLLSGYKPDVVFAESKKYNKDVLYKNINDEIIYFKSTALDMMKQQERGDIYKEIIINDYPKTHSSKFAINSLNNESNYNYKNFKKSVEKYNGEKSRYVWTGYRKTDDNLYIMSSGLASSGSEFLNSIGFFFLVDVGIRKAMTHFHNPVNFDNVVKSGGLFIDKNPDSKNKKEVYKELAQLYESANKNEKAITLYNMLPAGNEVKNKTAKLRNEIAKKWFYYAKDELEGKESIEVLNYVKDKFADTQYAKRTTEVIKEKEKKGSTKNASQQDKENLLNLELLKQSPVLTGQKKHIPLDISGSIGSSGVSAYPALQKISYDAEDQPLYK